MTVAELSIPPSIRLLDAMQRMDESARKVLMVVADGRLVGVVTDGDMRRWILKSGSLEAPIRDVMNPNPVYLHPSERPFASEIMRQNNVDSIPIVDETSRLLTVIFLHEQDQATKTDKISTPAVIMAGGKGTRLHPFTKILPKPLIPIGDVTITERILENFAACGCHNFYMTLNYRKNVIKAYFSDLPYPVKFIEEAKPLGTAGSLSYLREELWETFFVSNCDILIDADYGDILNFHRQNRNKITVVATLQQTIIPYGVISLNDDGSMQNTVEKPQYNHLINTGMYVLEPEVLQDIPPETPTDLPDLIQSSIDRKDRVSVYPISNNAWLDMGQLEEMKHMIHQLEQRN